MIFLYRIAIVTSPGDLVHVSEYILARLPVFPTTTAKYQVSVKHATVRTVYSIYFIYGSIKLHQTNHIDFLLICTELRVLSLAADLIKNECTL